MKYVLLINGGVFHNDGGTNVLDEQRVKKILQDGWVDGAAWVTNGAFASDDGCDVLYNVDELFDLMSNGEECEIYGLNGLLERGDDYVSLMLVELVE